jgi:hypothetical protein
MPARSRTVRSWPAAPWWAALGGRQGGGRCCSCCDGLEQADYRDATSTPQPPPLTRSAFAGFCFPPEVIVLVVCWYLRFAISYSDVEELLAERGIEVDHTTIYRWVPASRTANGPSEGAERRPPGGEARMREQKPAGHQATVRAGHLAVRAACASQEARTSRSVHSFQLSPTRGYSGSCFVPPSCLVGPASQATAVPLRRTGCHHH